MDNFMVYHHWDPETGDIVYVGVGALDRPWQVYNRSSEHKDWLIEQYKKYGDLSLVVELENIMISKEKALELEVKAIDSLRPKFNKNYDNKIPTVLNKERFDKAKDLRDQGGSYEAIAKELNVSTMAIHRALNGKVKAYDKWS